MRQRESIRSLVKESSIRAGQLVYPFYVVPGMDRRVQAKDRGLIGYSVDLMHQVAREVTELGIPAVYLYGQPEQKDPTGSEAYSPAGSVQRAVRAIKHVYPDLLVITDVCLCPYTDEGHCGIVEAGGVHNEATMEALQRMALSHAAAGADFVAPTDMMDGRVMAIRHALDEGSFEDVGIFAGSVIYASPFAEPPGRVDDEVGESRKTYRMDPANAAEALREAALNVEEGADVTVISPALFSLDVMRRIKETFQVPVAALSSEREVLMIRTAFETGIVPEKETVLESLLVQHRAGADILITPFAKDVAKWLKS